MASDQLDIAIVGGGIAGLMLALGLVKHKHVKVTIYEAAAKFGEIGAGLSFGPNARKAMSHISPEAAKGYEEIATYNLWPSKKDIWFDFRFGQDQPNGIKAGGVVSRTSLPKWTSCGAPSRIPRSISKAYS